MFQHKFDFVVRQFVEVNIGVTEPLYRAIINQQGQQKYFHNFSLVHE